MDQQPKIPTLKDAQKPQVKVKGMGAGLTLFDRLKQFKKKDLAFILAGLGTLFMAPLAEHFMMAPESGSELKGGFGGGQGGSGSNLFGNGSSPYENGNNSIAQGGAVGGAGDIITPLNVRDPSALVMGPGAAQQPPAGSAAPQVAASAPPAASSASDLKDALAGAASRAASAAVKKSPLPIPKIAVGGSGLRGLGAASGGSSAGASLGPIGPAAGSNGVGGGSGGLNLVRSNPNFRGVAGARSPTGANGLDGTKKAGANAGDAFSRTGNALGGLNAAASEQIPTGGTGFAGGGAGGAGANDKGGGGAGPGGSKSVGESLAFIEAKERMMENLKLEFEKRKLKDTDLLLYGIRNDVLKASAGEVGKWITKGLMDGADKLMAGSDANAFSLKCGSYSGPLKSTADDKTSGTRKNATSGQWEYYDSLTKTSTKCDIVQGAAKGAADPKAEGKSPTGTDGVNGDQPISDRNSTGDANNLKTACSDLGSIMKPDGTGKVNDVDQATARYKEAAEYSSIKKALVGETTDGCVFPTQKPDIGALASMNPSVASLQKDALDASKAAIDSLKAGVTKDEAEKGETYSNLYKTAVDKATKAREALDKVTAAAGQDLANVELGSSKEWSPSTLVAGDNGRKLGAIQNVLSTSRTEVSGKLKALTEAQGTIDGRLPGGALGPSKDPAIIGELANVVGGDEKGGAKVDGSPINVTQKTNAAFKTYTGSLEGKPVDAPADATAETIKGDKDGITGNATGGKGGDTSYDTRKAKADEAINASIAAKKAADADKTKQPEADKAKTAASDAVKAMKATVVGVQNAQTGWLDNIDKRVTEVRSKVPGATAAAQ